MRWLNYLFVNRNNQSNNQKLVLSKPNCEKHILNSSAQDVANASDVVSFTKGKINGQLPEYLTNRRVTPCFEMLLCAETFHW